MNMHNERSNVGGHLKLIVYEWVINLYIIYEDYQESKYVQQTFFDRLLLPFF